MNRIIRYPTAGFILNIYLLILEWISQAIGAIA
jgi:hypothetical protein